LSNADNANLGRLVAKAQSKELDLVSLMVQLRFENFWELLLIPAFVFFFQNFIPSAIDQTIFNLPNDSDR
jgi:hypothetical protein